jgi:DNA polymerase elongation subunit (family B)
MEKIKEMASMADEEGSKNVEQNASKWSELIREFVDKLTSRDVAVAVTYEFDNLEIDMPRASAGGQEIGSAKRKINDKFVISTELHDKSKIME